MPAVDSGTRDDTPSLTVPLGPTVLSLVGIPVAPLVVDETVASVTLGVSVELTSTPVPVAVRVLSGFSRENPVKLCEELDPRDVVGVSRTSAAPDDEVDGPTSVDCVPVPDAPGKDNPEVSDGALGAS
jgi:hypothetical protein